MPVTWRIEFAEGPRAGDKERLKPSQPTIIGRAKNTIDLLDPATSARHAEITWRKDRFWIRDLGSATGTIVGKELLDADKEEGVPLQDRSRVIIGETVLVLRKDRRLLPQWVYWVALVALAIMTPFFIGTILDFGLFDKLHPIVSAPSPVEGHRGLLTPVGETDVILDRCFMKELGAEARNATIRRVTDFDSDGVSEIWIEGPDWERVYTFAPGGQWLLLADLPSGCQYSTGSGFRPLTCGAPTYANETYVWRPGVPFSGTSARGGCAIGSNKGHYALQDISGVFLWARGRGEVGAAPSPWHIGLPNAELPLSSFLADRGITRPVHYVICEDFYPGISAQALTDRGQVVKLIPGCGQSIRIDGNRAAERFGNHRPLAMAFTRTGREMLLRQMSEYLGGSERVHFQNAQQRQWHDAISAPPTRVTSEYLAFEYQTPRPFDPIAPENRNLALQRNTRLKGMSLTIPAEDWTWADGDEQILRTPCGELVQVRANGWRCGPPCLSSTSFLEINHVGSSGPWTLGYAPGRATRRNEKVEVSIEIQSAGIGMVKQATYATLAARDVVTCSAVAPQDPPEAVPLVP